MKNVILTIDDGPSDITRDIVDYLNKNNIPALMFFIGNNIEKYFDSAIYAVESGILIGNHSYSHKSFSLLSEEEAYREIKITDSMLHELYKRCGINKFKKYFRFPFGDKGSNNKAAIQKILSDLNYENSVNLNIKYNWYYKNDLNLNKDVFWTFDCEDYLLSDEKCNIRIGDIFKKIYNEHPDQGGSLMNTESDEIIIMHDHPWSNKVVNKYYEIILDKISELNINFIN